jgi:hypothetical protein
MNSPYGVPQFVILSKPDPSSKMKTEPQKEHQWLNRLVGEWTYEGEATMEPGKPPEKFKGTESVRSVGGLWVFFEGRGEMPDGGEATTFMTLGYDPQKGRYVGTWVGSMMTYLWCTVDPWTRKKRSSFSTPRVPALGAKGWRDFRTSSRSRMISTAH